VIYHQKKAQVNKDKKIKHELPVRKPDPLTDKFPHTYTPSESPNPVMSRINEPSFMAVLIVHPRESWI